MAYNSMPGGQNYLLCSTYAPAYAEYKNNNFYFFRILIRKNSKKSMIQEKCAPTRGFREFLFNSSNLFPRTWALTGRPVSPPTSASERIYLHQPTTLPLHLLNYL
jgi:hypothetical protein